ncbi:unnamed protein product [Chrysoparadoxa australica]
MLCPMLLMGLICLLQAISPEGFICTPFFRTTRIKEKLQTAVESEPSPELTFEEIWQKLRLEAGDLEEGAMSIGCRDAKYGIEVVKTRLSKQEGQPLGLELREVASKAERVGLTLISDITGVAAADGVLKRGDTLTWVGQEPNKMESTEACTFDATVEAIGECPEGDITLVAKRLVRREEVKVIVQVPDGGEGGVPSIETTNIKMLSGSNLRMELIRDGLPVYDPRTKRFDQPYSTGDCGGESTCGTCFVEVIQGDEHLTPPDELEKMMIRAMPRTWRLACKTIVGKNNTPGAEVVLRLIPQSSWKDERRRRRASSL